MVLDEAYMDFWDQSLLSEVCEYDNLLILRTCSKALGMASLRLGFAVGNPTLTRALWAVKSPYNINSFTQAMGAVVLREKEWAQRALSLHSRIPGKSVFFPEKAGRAKSREVQLLLHLHKFRVSEGA